MLIGSNRSSPQGNRMCFLFTMLNNPPSGLTAKLLTGRAGVSINRTGGARRDRTDDLMLAKHALSQLSYGPGRCAAVRRRLDEVVGLGRLERPTSPLSGVRSNHLSYRPQAGAIFSDPGPGSSMKKEKRRRRRPANCPLTADVDLRAPIRTARSEDHRSLREHP